MQFILYLIQKHRNFLLFFVLELIALFFTIQFHSYQKSKFINSANGITGGLYNSVTSFRSYLYLKDENTMLIKENSELKNKLLKKAVTPTSFKDSIDLRFQQKFEYASAKIINNDFHKNNNFLTINKGKKDSISPYMAVVNAKGIIGITSNTSNNYTSAISVLNTHFKVNARLKKAAYFGTLTWNGKSYDQVQLIDIPRQASLKIGDTIVTGGRSAIFPEGILIGSVSDIEYQNNRYEKINVSLFNDVRNVSNVYIIKNLHKQEIQKLENSNND
ncbi:rod shape-determining protein MreC [Wenyingzhuangia heitensis]|uniref:Cell shape-determining protein MreC n=1 Tax=Wenyingzhuangia heitensis TaxID=1487859 RepID=A0ABX0UAL3_9FLAO|nr:rod shape-determining protein MreC [Wenyingzhuangia heitensis]NIJ45853.1 rod shape-determining protein MreC [Wenyingzhuangia heitensis]